MKRRVFWKIITGAAILSLGAGWLTIFYFSLEGSMTETTAQSMPKSPMHTICVGRYLMDVPEDYVLEYHDYKIYSVQYGGISHNISDKAIFYQKLSEREVDLRQKKNDYGQPSLEASEPLGNSPYLGHIFRFGRTKPSKYSQGVNSGLGVEIWLWFQTYGFKLYGESLIISYISEFSRRTRSLRPLAINEIPTEPGYCMETFQGRVFLPGAPGPDRGEITKIQFGLKNAPDIKFRMVHFTNSNKLDEPYLTRSDRVDREMGLIESFHVSTLRKGERMVLEIFSYSCDDVADTRKNQ